MYNKLFKRLEALEAVSAKDLKAIVKFDSGEEKILLITDLISIFLERNNNDNDIKIISIDFQGDTKGHGSIGDIMKFLLLDKEEVTT